MATAPSKPLSKRTDSKSAPQPRTPEGQPASPARFRLVFWLPLLLFFVPARLRPHTGSWTPLGCWLAGRFAPVNGSIESARCRSAGLLPRLPSDIVLRDAQGAVVAEVAAGQRRQDARQSAARTAPTWASSQSTAQAATSCSARTAAIWRTCSRRCLSGGRQGGAEPWPWRQGGRRQRHGRRPGRQAQVSDQRRWRPTWRGTREPGTADRAGGRQTGRRKPHGQHRPRRSSSRTAKPRETRSAPDT